MFFPTLALPVRQADEDHEGVDHGATQGEDHAIGITDTMDSKVDELGDDQGQTLISRVVADPVKDLLFVEEALDDRDLVEFEHGRPGEGPHADACDQRSLVSRRDGHVLPLPAELVPDLFVSLDDPVTYIE